MNDRQIGQFSDQSDSGIGGPQRAVGIDTKATCACRTNDGIVAGVGLGTMGSTAATKAWEAS